MNNSEKTVKLKTNTDVIAKPLTFFILLGVLKGYISNSLCFLVSAKLGFRKYLKDFTIDLPKDFINEYAFIAWLYVKLSRKIGKEKAFEVLRASVLTTGIAIQQANFRNVEATRNFNNLILFQKRAKDNGSTKLNSMEIITENKDKYEFRVTRCTFYELFSLLNVPELTTIFCSIDNAIFSSYLPEKIVFHRNGIRNTIADGNGYCEFVIEQKDKQPNPALS